MKSLEIFNFFFTDFAFGWVVRLLFRRSKTAKTPQVQIVRGQRRPPGDQRLGRVRQQQLRRRQELELQSISTSN